MNWLTQVIPWQPSPTVVVSVTVFAVLYLRGCRHEAVPAWRQLLFWTGLTLIYAALHTRLDYYAEREFFIHRLQHMVLHHLGPFLIALAWPGPALRAGVPVAWRTRWFDPLLAARPVRLFFDFLMNPVISGALFVGLIWLWLVPGVHFYAMLDVKLYRLMNWSMALDGLVFWFLTLDPRPAPPARLKSGVRVLLLAAVIPPQMASGAMVTLATSNLYPLYELCGRAFAGVTAHQDQTIGGLILWIPSTMMSLIGALIALYFWFRNDDGASRPPRTSPP